MSDDIIEVLRSFDNGRTSTHYLECWKVHPICALHRAADEIEHLEDLLCRAFRIAVGHGPDFEVYEDWEDAISMYERDKHRD
jgi:hypothetical protein